MLEGISKQQLYSLIFTFIVGVFSGVYLYVTVFAPTYRDGIFPSLKTISSSDFTIQATQYGGCQQANLVCPSYLFASNGALKVSPLQTFDEEARVLEFRESREVVASVRSALQQAPLESYISSSRRTDCETSRQDEFRFTIVFGDDPHYIIDTCATEFSKDTELFSLLRTFFRHDNW